MIFLFTGTPGAGKSLNAIKFVSEDGQFKNRPVFYYNIKDLKRDGWQEMDEDQCRQWYDLPEGAVLIIDECQAIFPPRKAGSPVPDHVAHMNVHRHKGIDIVLITQHPNLMDNAVRRLVGHHTHIERKFGLKQANHYTWPKCVTDVDNKTRRGESVSKVITLDRKYFGVYYSAEVHTHKARIPWAKIAFPVVALLLGVTGAYYVYDSFRSKGEVSPEVAGTLPDKSTEEQRVITDTPGAPKVETYTFSERFVPEVPDVPFSAPIYAKLVDARTMPKPNCVYSNSRDVCQCYSQQATRMDVSRESCLAYVRRGFFDFTRRDDGEGRKGAAPSGPSGRSFTNDEPQNQVRYWQDDGRPLAFKY